MNDATIIEFAGRDAVSDPLTELLRKGARELLQSAVEAELEAFLGQFVDRRTPEGRAGVVRNGHHPERAVQTGIGPVKVKIPKVRSKTGEPVSFKSALVPPYVRKAKTIEVCAALALFERHLNGRDGGGVEGTAGAGCVRLLSEDRVAPEDAMGGGV